MESVKIKISVLWMLASIWGIMGTVLMMFEASVIEQILAGEMEGIQITSELLLGLSVAMLIPLIMAFLSLTLKDKANRWANIIAGIGFAGFGLVDLIANIAKYSSYIILSGVVGTVFLVLVVWYAYKWEKD